MEAAGLSKILVSICQTIWHYISENHTVVSVVFRTGRAICVAHCQFVELWEINTQAQNYLVHNVYNIIICLDCLLIQ